MSFIDATIAFPNSGLFFTENEKKDHAENRLMETLRTEVELLATRLTRKVVIVVDPVTATHLRTTEEGSGSLTDKVDLTRRKQHHPFLSFGVFHLLLFASREQVLVLDLFSFFGLAFL